MNLQSIITVGEICKALKQKDRIKIVKLLHSHPRSSVTSIYKALKIGQTECSAHLSILRKNSLVITEKSDKNYKEVLYSLNRNYLEKIEKSFNQILSQN